MAARMLPSLSAVLVLSHAAAGFNLTFTGNCSDSTRHGLGADFQDMPSFNATGTTNFTMRALTGNDDPWYYYLTLHDGGQSGGPSYINRWLGVPGSFLDSDRGNRTRACMATSGGHDAGLKHAQGNDTCEGILSGKCAKKLRDASGLWSGGSCVSLDKDVEDECDIISTTGSHLLSRERSCFISSLPGVDVPEGYGVVTLIGIGIVKDGDKDKGAFKSYDRAVRQSIATFFTFIEDSDQGSSGRTYTELASQPVCAVPDVVQHNSRPVDSAAGASLPPSRPFILAAAAAALSLTVDAGLL